MRLVLSKHTIYHPNGDCVRARIGEALIALTAAAIAHAYRRRSSLDPTDIPRNKPDTYVSKPHSSVRLTSLKESSVRPARANQFCSIFHQSRGQGTAYFSWQRNARPRTARGAASGGDDGSQRDPR